MFPNFHTRFAIFPLHRLNTPISPRIFFMLLGELAPSIFFRDPDLPSQGWPMAHSCHLGLGKFPLWTCGDVRICVLLVSRDCHLVALVEGTLLKEIFSAELDFGKEEWGASRLTFK